MRSEQDSEEVAADAKNNPSTKIVKRNSKTSSEKDSEEVADVTDTIPERNAEKSPKFSSGGGGGPGGGSVFLRALLNP